MGKKKEHKEIDYSKMPDDIWEKTLREFIESMDNIEASLKALEHNIKSLK